MFLHLFLFEITYRLRRVSTYVYFLIWFVIALFATSVSNYGPAGTGKVLQNGPWALSRIFTDLTAFGTVVISALFGTSMLRDFQHNTFQLVFTKPISKTAYLGGRWAGSLAITLFTFSGMPLGATAGPLMPWADATRLTSFDAWFLLQPFLSITVVQTFFLGSVFFLAAALSRRLIVVYLQGVILYALYWAVSIYASQAQTFDRFWPSVFDPIGRLLFDTATEYWTVDEKNSRLLRWSGAFLYNRLLLLGLGTTALASAFRLFSMSAEALGARFVLAGRKQPVPGGREERPALIARRTLRLPPVTTVFGFRAVPGQLATLTRVRILGIVRSPAFWAIAIALTIVTADGVLYPRGADGEIPVSHVWPVTYLMAGVVSGPVGLFLFVIATIYTGELIWRERDVGFHQIHDSLPLPRWVNWLSQLLPLALVELMLLVVVMICGIGVQAASGYYRFELGVYVTELFVIAFSGILTYMLFAMFLHTFIPNKFAAHGALIGLFILQPILERYGLQNRLNVLGATVPYIYSDMNGYGHFVPPLFWSSVYRFAFFGLLGLLSIVFAARGTDGGWRNRWRMGLPDLRRLAIPLVVCAASFLGSGAWFYYNAHILNEYRTAPDRRRRQAEYERLYKKYERVPQPKITAVEANVDIFPEQRSVHARGRLVLVNHTAAPIGEVHVRYASEIWNDVRFDRAFTTVLEDRRHYYAINRLHQPLAPGESMAMDFRLAYESKGFPDGIERPELAFNGTFFDRGYFPSIGYDPRAELDNPVRRREEGLPPLEGMAPPGDPYDSNVHGNTPDSGFITFKAIVSTSPDQIAVAPGYLKREWIDGGRRYFEYDMGESAIANLYAFISGRFQVKRDRWRNVNLEIYYHPGHEYNLDNMLDSAKQGLDYFERNFGPYQFQQFRILEFPRYREFAQSLPNTVPYSEGLGFIQRVTRPEDIDLVFYVTAHELAHQWWGHQVAASRTQGAAVLVETLSQYSALMIMEKRYGVDDIRRFLRHELDAYLKGRSAEERSEPPLARVQREPYVSYNKGSLVMYALRDYIGEERLNAALRRFLEKHRYSVAPYPDVRDLLAVLREATPPDMHYVIADMFESITLFDNQMVSATWSLAPQNRYRVELTVDARKLKADGSGHESEVPIADLIDVGIFTGAEEHEKPLYLRKHPIRTREQTLTVVVDEQPTRAAIDPYHKLIDRNPDDNWLAVVKK
jgi:hypothetical protein